jgi:Ser-tRNA(Ala) deacylase AlaX
MQTKLIYMEYMHQYHSEGVVISVGSENGVTYVLLDQTIFYPQGGGQPYDTGIISNDKGIFAVTEVRYEEGVVRHFGKFELGGFAVGDSVICEVDVEKRKLHTRLHSLGHLLDIAVKELKLVWKPGKGYHFPRGPYIEYIGSLHGKEMAELAKEIEDKCHEIIARGLETRVSFDESQTQNGKPLRTVYYGEIGTPCGGTHVVNLSDIGTVTIRKIKQEKGIIRVSYA